MNHLLLLTRYPVAGTTKTRMIPVLGAEGAAVLQRQLTEYVVGRLLQPPFNRLPFAFTICYSGGSMAAMREWLGAEIDYRKQQGQTLAQRMRNAMSAACQQGAERVVLIGSDCPEVSRELIDSAFAQLLDNDLVLGPAMDGGYYLIGLKNQVMAKASSLFAEDLAWGGAELFTQTLERARKIGLTVTQLSPLYDIDEPDDLIHFRHYSDQKRGPAYRCAARLSADLSGT